eukprot:4393533-Amphidinium_carterae.1
MVLHAHSGLSPVPPIFISIAAHFPQDDGCQSLGTNLLEPSSFRPRVLFPYQKSRRADLNIIILHNPAQLYSRWIHSAHCVAAPCPSTATC